MFPLNKPEVIIPMMQDKVDAQGNVVDEHTIGKIAELLQALVDWTITLHPVQKEPTEEFQYNNAYGRMTN